MNELVKRWFGDLPEGFEPWEDAATGAAGFRWRPKWPLLAYLFIPVIGLISVVCIYGFVTAGNDCGQAFVCGGALFFCAYASYRQVVQYRNFHYFLRTSDKLIIESQPLPDGRARQFSIAEIDQILVTSSGGSRRVSRGSRAIEQRLWWVDEARGRHPIKKLPGSLIEVLWVEELLEKMLDLEHRQLPGRIPREDIRAMLERYPG
ncbi:MAG: hypothetical protein AAF585_22545 [Verrucomicrobiota bacterium]